MGYITALYGRMAIEPPLNQPEIEYLIDFARTRHVLRVTGDYTTCDPETEVDTEVFLDMTAPNHPSLWCDWVPTADGTAIVWRDDDNGLDEAHRDTTPQWLQYLINHFLTGTAGTFRCHSASAGFTFNHHCHGLFLADGADFGDIWEITVTDNQVTTRDLIDHDGNLTTSNNRKETP